MNALTSAKGAFIVALALFGLLSPVDAGRIYSVANDGIADFRTIQAAVDAAKTGDTIVLEPGVYTGDGNWDVRLAKKAVTIRSIDANDPDIVAATVIDCRGVAKVGRRAFVMTENSGAHLTLAGLTIINGQTLYYGGAIWCNDAGLTVINCTFSNNESGSWGGAVCAVNSTVTFKGCTFTNNRSHNLTGGAVYCGNSIASFSNCTFESNIGNAVVGRESGMTLVDCFFGNNAGQDGGGLHIYAGIENIEAYLNMSRCVFVGNTSNASGGAFHGLSAHGKIDRCTFIDNTTRADGGAIYTRHSTLAVTNSLFLNNTAAGMGGAVANSFHTTPQFVNCTFVGNKADAGGAFVCTRNANPLISHSILWDNAAITGPSLYLKHVSGGNYTAQATIEYSNIKHGPASTHTDPGCTLIWGKGNINADPLFTGPFRGDYRLSTDSPCIDAGDPAFIPPAGAADLDGAPRLYGAAVDMGAYEFQGLGPVYRFWSPVKGRHFYTLNGAERDYVIKVYPHIFDYEDVAFHAYHHPLEKGLAPVHRFWSPTREAHFWTIDEHEKDVVIKEMSETWVYEGVVFYAYPSGQQPSGASPVYRFWSDRLNTHFYTISERERDSITKAKPQTWVYEGIGWYAFTAPFQPKEITYNAAGGSDNVRYALTLMARVDGEEAVLDNAHVQLIPALAEMEMAVNFTDLTATFRTLHVATQTSQHTATITTKNGPIPMSLSIGATFTAPTQRGPFAIDPATAVFADYTKANESLTAEQAHYAYNGALELADTTVNFACISNAVNLELQSFGAFESFDELSDSIDVYMPLTFQWHRPAADDLLAEAFVDGQLVQIYITSMYVGTQGIWDGQAVR